MKKINHFRQGDLYLQKVTEKNIEDFQKVNTENGKLILAYGEVTGHHHSIAACPGVELFKNAEGEMILKIDSKVTIEHHTHSGIILDPGMYEAYIQEEYDPEGDRKVQD